MKILVTGGAGFIGSHIVEHYQDKAEEIRVLDNLRTGYLKNLEGLRHTFIEGSICDRELVRQAVQGSGLYFPHGRARLRAGIHEQDQRMHRHQRQRFAERAGGSFRRRSQKIVLASSAAIYGDNPTVPKLETMYPEPKSPYAITKLDGEYYLNMFRAEGKINTAAVRFFNVFGPGRTPRAPMPRPCPFSLKKLSKEKTSPCMGTAPRRAISFM